VSSAFLFPGQGSQSIGMLADLAANYDVVEATFAEASTVLGYDLWDLSQNGTADEIAKTEITQPLLLTASIAVWRVAMAQGLDKPSFVAGHSLGEWSALVAASVVEFKDAVKAVQLRGRFMQSAVPAGVGAMAAVIGLSDEAIAEQLAALDTGSESVEAVNFNAPGQVVIAGHAGAIDKAIEALKAAGAKRAMPLAVSAPFHTCLMKPAAQQLAEHLESVQFSNPEIPVVHNVTADTAATGSEIKGLMIEQIYSPVRWVECVKTLQSKGVDSAFECGSGNVLAGLVKRIDRSLPTQSLANPDFYQS